MIPLNFPSYNFRYKKRENKIFIFDQIRKKFILLLPEEWVRQNVVSYLLKDKKYPKSLINVEKVLKINSIIKRYDIIVFNPDGTISILIECKSPKIKISQESFDQIAQYNIELKANYLMISNGINHFYFSTENDKYLFLKELPEYESLK